MKKQLIEKLSLLITSAFGMVAALAWNDTIKSIFDKVITKPNTPIAMIIYAVVVTMIAVAVIIEINDWAEKANGTELGNNLGKEGTTGPK